MTASGGWGRMTIEKNIISNTMGGVMIGCFLLFLFFNVITLNILMSLFMIIVIIGVQMSFMMIMSLSNWEFGRTEAFAVIVTITFEISYTLFVIQAYYRNLNKDSPQEDIIQSMLKEVGPTIFGSFIVVFFVSAIIVNCNVLLFRKPAIMILVTSIFSFIYSMLFIPAVLLVFGKKMECANFKPCLIKIAFFKKLLQHTQSNENKEKENSKEENNTSLDQLNK
jgi:predicted RND superfamily exporter protein